MDYYQEVMVALSESVTKKSREPLPGEGLTITHCDMHIMQLLKVIGMTLEQTLRELSVLKV